MYRCIQHYLQMLENKACDYLYNKMRFLVLLKKVENLAIRLLSYFISEVVKIKVFFTTNGFCYGVCLVVCRVAERRDIM